MTTVSTPSQPTGSKPSSWKSAISRIIANRTSGTYSYLKNRVTYPLSSIDSKQASTLNKETSPSFLDSIKKGVSSITTKQCITAVALVAIGYAYVQAPNFDEVRGRLFSPIEEPSSPKAQTDWTQTLTLIFTGLLGVQNILQSNREALLLDRIGVLIQQTAVANQRMAPFPEQLPLLFDKINSIKAMMNEMNTKLSHLDREYSALKQTIFENMAEQKIDAPHREKFISDQFTLLYRYLSGMPSGRRNIMLTPPSSHSASNAD